MTLSKALKSLEVRDGDEMAIADLTVAVDGIE
jgi:hypothetical protein